MLAVQLPCVLLFFLWTVFRCSQCIVVLDFTSLFQLYNYTTDGLLVFF